MTGENNTHFKRAEEKTEMEAAFEVFEAAKEKFRGKSPKKVKTKLVISLISLAVLLGGTYLWYELYDGKEQAHKWVAKIRAEVGKSEGITEIPESASDFRFQVALEGFRNESSDSGVSTLLTELLLRDLMRKKSGGVNITQSRTTTRKRRRFNAVVTGTVLSFSVDTDKRSSTARYRYQAGTKKEETIDYQVVKERINSVEKDVKYGDDTMARARRNLARQREESRKTRSRTGGLMGNTIGISNAERSIERAEERLREAQRRLAEAKRELSSTTKYEDVPAYKDYRYTTWDYTKVASLKVSCQLVDSSSDNVLFSDVVYESASSSDETYDGNSSAGLRSDPLELASDETLRSEVIRRASDELSGKIASALRDMGKN